MRGGVYETLAIPAAFWASPETLDVLGERDIGHLFRRIQKATGASQTQIGIATGLSQAQVSEIMGGRRQVNTIDVLDRIMDGLGIPDSARIVLLCGDRTYQGDRPSSGESPPPPVDDLSDVVAVYPTRSEFTSRMPPHTLLDGARDIRAAGLSLNLICQQYSDNRLLHLVTGGATLRCLFLDPDGEAIKAREREEGYPDGYLSSLTQMNIRNLLHRVRDRLPSEHRANLQVAIYDETIRFNLVFVDEDICVAQPYLPEARGVDSPTFVIRRRQPPVGLYPTFDGVFTALWERSQPR